MKFTLRSSAPAAPWSHSWKKDIPDDVILEDDENSGEEFVEEEDQEKEKVVEIIGTPALHAKVQFDRRDIDRILIYEPTHKWWEPPMRAWVPGLNHEILYALVVWNISVVLLARFTNLCGNEDSPDIHCDEDWMLADDSVNKTLGVGLFLLLSFRANEAYKRFWEGRKAWGRVRELCRDLTRQICFHVKPKTDEEKVERHRIIGFIGAFASTLKLHLRRERNVVPELGKVLVFQDILNIEKQQNMPQYCMDVVSYYLVEQYEGGKIGEVTLSAMTQTCLAHMADNLGTCERIRNQPIPLSYTLHLRFYIILWLILYPFHLVTTYSWFSIALASFVDYAVLGIESMACEIENPFGYNKNCIDLCKFCQGIHSDIKEILERAEHKDAKAVFSGYLVRKRNDRLYAINRSNVLQMADPNSNLHRKTPQSMMNLFDSTLMGVSSRTLNV